ncbi:LUD domain-containing protein [uncultured Polaribacter sp.]|uniref:LUD domain-containing protein n=1 Tax=uncultured Polaribacter sp. TaxID=174711 RepID=UPI00262E09FD|nr:LUD domain-containing protein [uncultured Polaribacter sp.]
MKFLKKLFNLPVKEDEFIQKQEVNLSLDNLFVHHFIEKGGKFLYCLKKEEVKENLNKILKETSWDEILVNNKHLTSFIDYNQVKTTDDFKKPLPYFTKCEHLIADNGDVLFSSNQLRSHKLSELSEHLIVYATTSQLVRNTGEALTGIKTNSKGKLPTNISSVKNYNINKNDDNFLNYGNNNSKNLYLLLLEDL